MTTTKVITDEHRRKLSEASKRRWQDPEYREKAVAAMRERARARWSDPEYRARIIKILREANKPPKGEQERAENSRRMKGKWADPEWAAMMRERQRQGALRRWAKPGAKEAASEAASAAWTNPKRKPRARGEKQ